MDERLLQWEGRVPWGKARGRTGQRRNPGGRGLRGAEGSWYVRAGEREEKKGIHSASLQLFPGPLEEFTDRRKTERRTDLVDRSGAHARNGWATDDQRATQRGHQGGT